MIDRLRPGAPFTLKKTTFTHVRNIKLLNIGDEFLQKSLTSLSGLVVPSLLALASWRVLLSMLGPDRLGIVALAWAVIGFSSLFDFGLGRSLTRAVSERIGEANDDHVVSLFWSAELVMLSLGCAAMGLVLGAQSLGLLHIHLASKSLSADADASFAWVAVGIPAIMVTSGARGLLEGIQRFKAVALGRLFLGILAQLAPCAVALLGYRTATAAIGAIVCARFVTAGFHLWLCGKAFPPIWRLPTPRRADIVYLSTTGAWLTISNIISPIMVSLDRFVVATLVSTAAVAYYATPVDTLGRLLVVPGAMASVSFVLFAKTPANRATSNHHLFDRSVSLTSGLLGPILVAISLFARELMTLWLGSSFASQSYRVTQIICLGVFFNALAATPLSLIQGAGKMRTTAQLHMIELLIYAPACWWLIKRNGIDGAAIAWTLRMSFDAAAMFLIASRQCPDLRPLSGTIIGAGGLLTAAALFPVESVAIRSILCVGLALHSARTVAIGEFAWGAR